MSEVIIAGCGAGAAEFIPQAVFDAAKKLAYIIDTGTTILGMYQDVTGATRQAWAAETAGAGRYLSGTLNYLF